MKASDKKLNLLDLVDKKFLQEFQDNFAKTTGFACVILNEEGFITEPSNFCDFCLFMKGNTKIYPVCSKCDLEKRELGFKRKEPFTYTCHAGLTNFMVPIVVNNQTIALIVAGQTFTESPDEKLYNKLAKKFGLDEEEYLKKVESIKISSKEKVEAAKSLLSQVANFISNIAHQNYELQKMNFREKLLREVAEILRSSLDLNKVKQGITQLIGKAFNADRCFFRAFDKAKGKFLAVDVEYLGSKEVKSLVDVESNQEGLKFFIEQISKQKKGFYPIIADREFAKGTPLEDYMKQTGIVADYAIPIIDRYDELNWFVLHYSKKDPKLSEEDKKLLESIAYQMATVFEQIKMYEKEKQTAEREILLRKIISTIRESLDLNTTFNIICSEINRITGANRVTIFQSLEASENHSIRGEFKKSKEIKSVSEMNVKERVNVFKYLKSFVFKTGKPLFINNIRESNVPEYVSDFYKNLDVKSLAAFPIKRGKDEWGILTISHIDYYKYWNQIEIDFVEAVIEQVYIAINQAELYSKMQQQNAREKAILTNLPFLVWLKDKESKFLATNELFAQMCGTTPDNLVGKTDYDFWSKEFADGYVKADKEVMQKRQTKSVEELIKGPNGARWHETYKTPIYNDKGEVVGTTGFARDITESKEAQEKIIKAAKRETLLRKIIEKIRISLDIEEVLSVICEEVAKLFNVQRTVIACASEGGDPRMFFKRKEYNVSQDLSLITDEETFHYIVKIWTESVISTGKNVVFNNMKEADAPEPFKNAYIKIGVKSAIGTPIKRGTQVWGNLILFDYNQIREWTDEEQYLLEAIANQIYIAIHQAELFEKEKLSAEREKISRNIIEILRSSIDKSIIKKLFVKNLGKFFSADRVFLAEYNSKINTLMPIDNSSEYLSSENEKTSTNYDFTSPEFSHHVDALLEKREIRIENFEEFVKQNHGLDEKLIEHYKEANTKSSYAFPIVYQDQILGAFALQFTHQIVKLSNEDLGRIRSICTQAGIALYHANLYEKAKECEASKQSFMLKVSEQIGQPVQEILDISILLSQNEFEHSVEIEYLNKIIGSCNNLLELTTEMDGDNS